MTEKGDLKKAHRRAMITAPERTIFKDIAEFQKNEEGTQREFGRIIAGRCYDLEELKKILSDVEIYAHPDLIERLKKRDEQAIEELVEDTIHEILHREGLDELDATTATDVLLRDIRLKDTLGAKIKKALKWKTWELIKCPKTGKNIGWEECLRCPDDEKHSTCPDWAIRSRSAPRRHEFGVYHVTELVAPRQAYFNRKYAVAKAWTDSPAWMRFFMGKAFHRFYQEAYRRDEIEIKVEHDYGDFKVTGSADVVSGGLLRELKTHGDLGKVGARGPNLEHVWQAQAYYSLLKATQPWLAREVKKIRVLYAGLTRADTWRDFDVEPKDISDDIYARARALHEALKANEPPAQFPCPNWMCKYCDYASQCHGERLALYRKTNEEFARRLERHAEGVKKVVEMLKAAGHEVEVNPLAVSDEIISDPAHKQHPEFDILDKTTGEKIDVKTTALDHIWLRKEHLEIGRANDFTYYFVFADGEIRRAKAIELWETVTAGAGRYGVREHTNQFGEVGWILPKDAAEAVR